MAHAIEVGHAAQVADGYIDLHCHWICAIDDGARNIEESRQMLQALADVGFSEVFATPHMRPGMFDNSAKTLTKSYEDCVQALGIEDLPVSIGLACEHYLDDVVYERIIAGEALPYPGSKAVLVECYELGLSPWWFRPLQELKSRGYLPVIAHPERYRALWQTPTYLEELCDLGASPLLDVAALTGRYGRRPRECALKLLELDLYDGACSDAHRPEDLSSVAAGIDELAQRFGSDRVDFLMRAGPSAILRGLSPR